MMGICGMDSFFHIRDTHNDANSLRIEVPVFSIDIPRIDRSEMVGLQQREPYLLHLVDIPNRLRFHPLPALENIRSLYQYVFQKV